MDSFINEFEQRFENSIPRGFDLNTILLAVSGGADSMAMLSCTNSLINNSLFKNKYKNVKIKVVTINHRLRPEEESLGDCLFVKEFCDKNNIPCFIENADINQIENLSKQRNMGIEESARYFRYKSFEKIALKEHADLVFLAHNKDDQLETLIQRFFQGAFSNSSLGIPKIRDIYYRPMLDFSKDEIYKYLNEKKVKYRVDKTNFENNYLRNKIRNQLIPNIEKIFPGWKSSLINGAKKKKNDEDFFENECKKYLWDFSENECSMSRDIFDNLHKSIKIRLVYQCLSKIKATQPVPYEIIEYFCQGNKTFSSGINFYYSNDKVFINNKKNSSTDSYFFAIIENDDGFPKIVSTPIGKIRFTKQILDSDISFRTSKIPCLIEVYSNKIFIQEIPSVNSDSVFYILEDY